jgi:hypothetical protein
LMALSRAFSLASAPSHRILSRSDWCPDFICKANLDAYKDVILPEDAGD